jgi:hypothetical protein
MEGQLRDIVVIARKLDNQRKIQEAARAAEASPQVAAPSPPPTSAPPTALAQGAEPTPARPSEEQVSKTCIGPLALLAEPAWRSAIQESADKYAEIGEGLLAQQRSQRVISDDTVTVDDFIIVKFLIDMERFPEVKTAVQSVTNQLIKTFPDKLEYRRQLREQVVTCVPAVAQRWSRLSEQIFRVDKWSVCRG